MSGSPGCSTPEGIGPGSTWPAWPGVPAEQVFAAIGPDDFYQVRRLRRPRQETRPFLDVTGKLQVEDGVTHIIAESLRAPSLAPAALAT